MSKQKDYFAVKLKKSSKSKEGYLESLEYDNIELAKMIGEKLLSSLEGDFILTRAQDYDLEEPGSEAVLSYGIRERNSWEHGVPYIETQQFITREEAEKFKSSLEEIFQEQFAVVQGFQISFD